MPTVERLKPRHAGTYRALMLDAYRQHPEAFTSAVDERAALPLTWWEDRLSAADDAGEVVFGMTEGDALLGVVGVAFNRRQKTRHKVSLFGMYVVPGQQHKGLGKALMTAALTCASSRPHAQLMQLTVSEHNSSALALYQQSGFVAFGLEPCAIATDTGFVSKVHMWRLLTEG